MESRFIVLCSAIGLGRFIGGANVASCTAEVIPMKSSSCLSKRFRLGSIGILAMGTLPFFWMAFAPSSVASTNSPVTSGAASLVGQTSLPDQLESLGNSAFSSTFGGVVVTDGETKINVYLTSIDASAESQFQNLSPIGTINFLQTPNSLAAMKMTIDEVSNSVSSLDQSGINVASSYIDIPTGTVVIQVANNADNAVADSTLNQEFGARKISIQFVSGSAVPRAYGEDRISDQSPWNGSDSLSYNGVSGKACSSGFGGSTSAHAHVVLTAAHCLYPQNGGEATYNQIATPSGWNPANGTLVGSVVAQSVDGTDLIGATPSGHVYGGPIDSPVNLAVVGYTSNPVGDDVCTDGSYDGELGSNSSPSFCGSGTGSSQIQITSDDACLYNVPVANDTPPSFQTTQTLCGLVLAKSLGSPQIAVAGPGDSGGPVFRFTGSGANLYAVGLIQGGSGSVKCPFNTEGGTRLCGTTVDYSAMSQLVSDWGLSLATG
jgi:hypothetical protein